MPQVELDGGHTFKFCTLPGIVLLKLIAWNDRPELRRSDIIDISDILHHFFHMYDEVIWQHHSDLFEAEEADLLHISAQVMGRELGRLTADNNKIYRRVQSILRGKVGSNDDIAVIMVDYCKNTVEENSRLLLQVIKGFEERKR